MLGVGGRGFGATLDCVSATDTPGLSPSDDFGDALLDATLTDAAAGVLPLSLLGRLLVDNFAIVRRII